MKAKSLMILYLLFVVFGCNNKKNLQTKNSPLASVVKLNAAEFLLDYEEAKNYIDINSVYGAKNQTDNLSPEQRWKKLVSFMSGSTDKKFTRQFQYYNYDIIENVHLSKAEVMFKPKSNANMSIIYKLELRNNVWIVYEIDYNNK